MKINKYKLFFITCCGFFVFSLLTQVYVTNLFAVKGNEVARLTQRKNEVEQEISALILKKSNLTALPVLQAKATEQGFVELTSPLLLLQPVSVASLNSGSY